MMRPAPQSNQFILEAFDREQWCPVLQALLHVPDLEALRAILGETAADDLELRRGYALAQLNRILRGSVVIVARRDGPS